MTEELENIEENAYLRGRKDLKEEIQAYLAEHTKFRGEYGTKVFEIGLFLAWLEKV